jgi:thioredoxin reductase
MFDVLIIGGGVSGMSCALVLGLQKNKNLQLNNRNFHSSKIISRKLFFNNAYGIPAETLGSDLLCKAPTAIPTLPSCHSNTRKK